MNAHFEFLGPPRPGSLFELVPGSDYVVVGRANDCELVLPSTSVSRRHARLRWQAAGLWVEDLGSANGTFVNGERLTSPRRLQDQDRVAFGPIELRFTSPPAAATPEPPTSVAEDSAATLVLPGTAGAAPSRTGKEPTPITMVLPASAAEPETETPDLDSLGTASGMPRPDAEAPPAAAATAVRHTEDAAPSVAATIAVPRRDDSAPSAAATMAVPRKDDSAPSAAATMAVPRKDDSAPSAAGTMAVPRRDEPDPSPATTAFARTESPAATTGATRTAPASDALLPRSTAPAARPPSTAELAAIAVGSFLAVFAFGLALAYWLR